MTPKQTVSENWTCVVPLFDVSRILPTRRANPRRVSCRGPCSPDALPVSPAPPPLLCVFSPTPSSPWRPPRALAHPGPNPKPPSLIPRSYEAPSGENGIIYQLPMPTVLANLGLSPPQSTTDLCAGDARCLRLSPSSSRRPLFPAEQKPCLPHRANTWQRLPLFPLPS